MVPWNGLATKHVEAALEGVEYFLKAAVADLTSIAGKDPVAGGAAAKNDMEQVLLREIVVPFISHKTEEMKVKLENLLHSYRVRNPITYNHYFTENVQKLRKKRLRDRMVKELQAHLGVSETQLKATTSTHINVAKFIEGLNNETEADMDEFACVEIVDYMEAYYKVMYCIKVVTSKLIFMI